MEELQLADGLDWRLVHTVWQQRPLDQEVICKLLCTSQAMARLVHATFAGQLKAKMQSLCMMPSEYMYVYVLQKTPADSWLARNAMLLKSFEFWPGGAPDEDGDESADEELVSEGFAAAAAAATDAAAAADGAAAGSNRAEPSAAAAAAGLPLQRLVCGAPSASRLLHSVAGIAPHLTSLCLCVADVDRVGFSDYVDCLDALAALTSLPQLTLAHGAPPGAEYGPSCYNVHLQSLQHLTQLTALDLAPVQRGWPDAPNPWQEAGGLHMRALPSFPKINQVHKLPPSVVDLAVALDGDSGPIDLRHMPAVTQLYVGGLRGTDRLPTGVKHLQLHDNMSLQPVLEGCSQHLRELRLDCELFVCELPAAFHQQLSQLNTLHIRVQLNVCSEKPCSKGWVQGCGQLAQLPSLHSLEAHWQSRFYRALTAPAVAAFASCTQLTRLSLCQNLLGDGSAVLELAPRLARMHCSSCTWEAWVALTLWLGEKCVRLLPSCRFCGKWSLRTAVCLAQRASWLLQCS